jgi:orotate phosphoribosyltransferase
MTGRVLIVDDVISAGTSVRESGELIRSAAARPAAVVIALDRMERGQGPLSATQEVQQTFGIPVISIATLEDLVTYLSAQPGMARELQGVSRYRQQYGIS